MKRRERDGLNSLYKGFVNLKDRGVFGEPWHVLAEIVLAAIMGSPELRLTLDELCEVIPRRFAYYRDLAKKEGTLYVSVHPCTEILLEFCDFAC